jgi:glycosyltransferase involved in cell wall biosynthesis
VHLLQRQHPPAFTGKQPPGVSIVIPVYNESQRIAATLDAVAAFLDDAPFDAEVIVADDGSTDATRAIAAETLPRLPCGRLLELPHGGKARAVLAGLAEARGDIVGFMDADLATPLATMLAAVERIADGADVVIGSREGAGSRRIGEPEYRHLMGRVFNGIVRLALLPGIHDTQCGFKFATRASWRRILPLSRLYRGAAEVTQPRVTAFDVELLYIARSLGLRIDVLPVTWSYGTSSKVNPIRDTLQNLWDVAQVWLHGRRGLYEPGPNDPAVERP